MQCNYSPTFCNLRDVRYVCIEALGETPILLGITNEVENLIPVSNLSDNPADFECKFATSGRISTTSDNTSTREDHIGEHENDGNF